MLRAPSRRELSSRRVDRIHASACCAAAVSDCCCCCCRYEFFYGPPLSGCGNAWRPFCAGCASCSSCSGSGSSATRDLERRSSCRHRARRCSSLLNITWLAAPSSCETPSERTRQGWSRRCKALHGSPPAVPSPNGSNLRAGSSASLPAPWPCSLTRTAIASATRRRAAMMVEIVARAV